MTKTILIGMVSVAFVAGILIATEYDFKPQPAYGGPPPPPSPFLGQMMWVGFNYAPPGWANCDGQILSISQNIELFSILGTNYGGDGRSTFGLPDLRGRVMVDDGTGPGLTQKRIGQRAGAETLSQQQVGIGTSAVVKLDSGTAQSGFATTSLGMSQSHNNMQPYLTVNCIIAIQGFMPSRPPP